VSGATFGSLGGGGRGEDVFDEKEERGK